MPARGIAEAISTATGDAFVVASRLGAGGGCINDAETLTGRDGRRFFVKLNTSDKLDMFEAENAGLNEINHAAAIRAPRPICSGVAGGRAFLVLEHLNLGGGGDDAELAKQLATLHRFTQPHFGWYRDNTIGATAQHNTPSADWAAFWQTQRLGVQIGLAERQGASHALLDKLERLLEAIPVFFTNHRPEASLLHGDLWGGNYGFSEGQPVLFDPAIYYGDREADLAMTELFGGFSSTFYSAYQDHYPLDPGYRVRKTLYNLYHVLNHFVMFGGSYATQADRMCDQLLAETR
jgi:fructosamine-3-kinase